MRRRRKGAESSRSGFTLIEILIVLAIIALVLSLGMPAIQSVTNQRINSTTRRFTGLIRAIRNDAILLNLIHRLVINFDDQTWWIESQKKFGLLEEEPPEDGEEVPDTNFTYAEKYTTEPRKMPGGVVFSGVRTERDGLISKGVAYVHFFPNGFTEQSILYLSKEGAESVFYSMILRPTSGRIELQPGPVEGF